MSDTTSQTKGGSLYTTTTLYQCTSRNSHLHPHLDKTSLKHPADREALPMDHLRTPIPLENSFLRPVELAFQSCTFSATALKEKEAASAEALLHAVRRLHESSIFAVAACNQIIDWSTNLVPREPDMRSARASKHATNKCGSGGKGVLRRLTSVNHVKTDAMALQIALDTALIHLNAVYIIISMISQMRARGVSLGLVRPSTESISIPSSVFGSNATGSFYDFTSRVVDDTDTRELAQSLSASILALIKLKPVITNSDIYFAVCKIYQTDWFHSPIYTMLEKIERQRNSIDQSMINAIKADSTPEREVPHHIQEDGAYEEPNLPGNIAPEKVPRALNLLCQSTGDALNCVLTSVEQFNAVLEAAECHLVGASKIFRRHRYYVTVRQVLAFFTIKKRENAETSRVASLTDVPKEAYKEQQKAATRQSAAKLLCQAQRACLQANRATKQAITYAMTAKSAILRSSAAVAQ